MDVIYLFHSYSVLFFTVTVNIWGSLASIGGGLAAFSFIGAGIGQGLIGAKSVEAIGRNPEVEGQVRRQMILSAAIAESGSIYGLIVSLVLIFVVAGNGQPS